MSYLTRNGVRLYYEDHGQGLPILLTHGFAASTGMWRGQVEAFAATYRLIPWDMRGHGASDCPKDQSQYSQAHTVEDMRELLDHLAIDQAIIAGHSLGGFMSLAFYVAYPERVRALILQGCGPGYRNPQARATWNERAEQHAQTLEQHGLEAVGGGSEVRVSQLRSAKGLAQAARGILAQVDSRVIDTLPHITMPTLLIVGENDTPFLNGMSYMAEHIPQTTKLVIANAGHGANVEQPDIFNRAMNDFLSTLSTS